MRKKPHLDFINDFQVWVNKEGERRFKGKLAGGVPGLLTTRVNICQERKASHSVMSSLFLDFGSVWFFSVFPGCTVRLCGWLEGFQFCRK